MKIGIDLDGVCYDFAASVRRYMEDTQCDTTQCSEALRWEFYEDWGMSLGEFLDCFSKGVNTGTIFWYGDPHPGTREALQTLREYGHTLHIITDRSIGSPGIAAYSTLRWLAEHNIPYDTITFSKDKTVVPTDFMIDDKLENYDELDGVGCEVWLFDRPWNQAPGPRRRVYSIEEFVQAVLDPVAKFLMA